MRIALVVYRFPLISETFVVNLAVGLLRAGHDVEIVSFGPPLPSSLPRHPSVERYRLEDRHRFPMTPASRFERMARLPQALYRTWKVAGVTALRTLPLTSRYRRVRRLSLPFEAATFAALNYDVVHCQFLGLGRWMLDHFDIGTMRGKFVVHVRGHDISVELKALGSKHYRRLFDQADWFVANSEHFRRRLVGVGCAEAKTSSIPSGIDLDSFPFRRREPPSGAARIVAVGRLVEKKGFADALSAVAKLRDAGRDICIDIVGDGPLRPWLQTHASALGLADRAVFHGVLTSVGVARILSEAHAFVAPSVTAADGDEDAGTNTLKEAMAVGIPAVATLHGGIPELIEDGMNGFLVPERAPDRLAARLAELLDDRAQAARFAAAARDRVAAMACNDVVCRRIIHLYEGLLPHDAERATPSVGRSGQSVRTAAGAL